MIFSIDTPVSFHSLVDVERVLKNATNLLSIQRASQPNPTGFAVLGYVLTRIEKKSFDQLLAEHIAVPLGMTNTSIHRQGHQISGLLDAFDVSRSEVSHWNWDVFAPTGGILSTADDMMKYLAANISPPDSPLGNAIQESQKFGLGWDSEADAKIIFKNGQTGGFHSILSFNPKQRTGIFVIGNLGSTYTDYVASAPFGVPMPDLMGVTLTEADLDARLGSYAGADGTLLNISKPGKFRM